MKPVETTKQTSTEKTKDIHQTFNHEYGGVYVVDKKNGEAVKAEGTKEQGEVKTNDSSK